ncbi:acetate/propionate family kinase [Dyadobacter sp. Leaf189]|uniref:acetate/propionate family kinase n=1 Tax=Dyadobacter sp. Leaf189 TaxID=1736295 RepID=UPI0006FAAE13|nr:acetate kinase [Dyadobacter sp. Leaf189]KQS30936.1 acetate kinase [Dyadobacter sp. Leaf189]
MNILVINAGSSSLKYQFFRMPSEAPLCTGIIEKIGAKNAFIKHKTLNGGIEKVLESEEHIADHAVGLNKVLRLLSDPADGLIQNTDEIAAVGHRVVHGGDYFSKATRITADIKEKIRELSDLAPLHNPVSLECIEVAEATFPKAVQVAVFDTAFHQTIPEVAYRYAIPEKLYEKDKMRVYGFHGTSHGHVTQKAMQWLGRQDARIISIHLGNGCSITAVDSGRSVDTSMGFGPLSGLIMGTRSGDIDPSVLLHLMDNGTYTPDEISDILNKQSGLRGFTGSNDMRDVRRMQQEGSRPASLILDMYAYRIKKYIGAYAAVLNGLDAIVFTAGVGENDVAIREAVCTGMDYLNIHLDKEKNSIRAGNIREISRVGDGVKILVVPTNEELEIAQQTLELL